MSGTARTLAWATAPLEPLRQLDAAVVREKPSGGPPGGWHPESALGFEEALRAYTQTPADASGWGDRIGSLEAGKWEDFVILDGALGVPWNETLTERAVRTTYFAGRRVYASEDE